jgi:hypothetical protein
LIRSARQKAPLPRHLALTRAQRLKRVFKFDVCERCGGAVKIVRPAGPCAPSVRSSQKGSTKG